MILWLRSHGAALVLLVLGSVSAASCSGETDGVPHFVRLDVASWEGAAWGATDLGRWVEGGAEALPLPCRVVVYRATCGACAQHLANLDRGPSRVPLVLLEVPGDLPEPGGVDARSHAPPEHAHLPLVALDRGYGFTAPAAFFVDATGTLRQVRDAETLAKDL